MDVTKIETLDQFNDIQKNFKEWLVIVHFTAKWSPHCQQLHDVLEELKKQMPEQQAIFIEVEAEDHATISQKFGVMAVPTCILSRNGVELDRIEGINIQELHKKIQQHMNETNMGEDLDSLLKSLINQSPVMTFIKGTPDQPKCGFTRTLVTLLRNEGVKFSSFDILSNERVRQGLKEFSNWPTYPQLYINGEFIGGLDIVKELIDQGEFSSLFPKTENLEDKLMKLIKQEEIMLFMKGSPDQPKCGFSKSIVEILNSKNAKYGHFDIITNDEVRQGLKEFSNWPTYPQLYVRGDLIGGVDIVKELNQSGELDDMLKN